MVMFSSVGGAVCLDFVNTGSQRREGPFKEQLSSYDDLLAWAVEGEQLGIEEAERLKLAGAADPRGAEAVVRRGRELREAIYRVFTARFYGEVIPADDLRLISDEYARATANRALTPTEAGNIDFEWRNPDALDRPLWPIAVSAAVLASSDEAVRVKECATDNCNWLFLDASKNRSRRWCEMKECGNRAKARRHYHRHRTA
jgi:predicted RNA-binding Zn ribbon-like protein